MRWRYDTSLDGPRAQFHAATMIHGTMVITATDSVPVGFVYAFDAATGATLWKQPYERGVSALALDGESLAAVTAWGDLVVLDARTGVERFQKPSAPRPEMHVSQPAFHRGRLFVAATDGSISALEPRDGSAIWTTTLSAPATTSLLIAGEKLYAGLANGRVVALSLDAGEIAFEATVGDRLFGSLTVQNSTLFAFSMRKGVMLLNALDLALARRWEQPSAGEWMSYTPLFVNGLAIAGDDRKMLYAFRISDGELQWSHPVDGVPRGLGYDGARLFVGTLSGKVFAFPLAAER